MASLYDTFGTLARKPCRDEGFKFRTTRLAGRKPLSWADVTWTLLLFFGGCHGYQEQRFAMEPQDQSAVIGSRVTLPCRVENKIGVLQWTKDDFGLGTHRNLTGYERYFMIGSDDEGDYSLDIKEVSLDDDGTYQCQVSSGLNGELGIRSRYAKLSVLVAPEPPRIVQGAFIDATEDQQVLIECVSVGGKPASEVLWIDGNQNVLKDAVENTVTLLADGQRYTTRSILKLNPKKEYHNQTFTCQAQNTADRAYRVATVHIEVKYAPKVSVFVKSGTVNGRIPEWSEARIGCEVDANPSHISYKWYIDNNPVIGDYTNEMILFNVSRLYNDAIVKCEVTNSVGKSEQTMSLDVSYPPTFLSRPLDVEASEGESVTLNCEVEGHPEPEIRWLLHEPGRIGVKGKSSSLKMKVGAENAGRYLCKATVEGYSEIETEATVFIKGPPKLLSNNSLVSENSDEGLIECVVLSVPKPDDVRWYYNNEEISLDNDQDFEVLKNFLSYGVLKSSLVIKNNAAKYYGQYNCSVTNEFGNANATIVFKHNKTFPLLVILTSVSIGIIGFSALILGLVLCHRKRRTSKHMNEKPDLTVTTADLYKDSDRSSNISDLKLQLPPDGSYELDYTSSEHTGSNPKLSGLPLAGPVHASIRDESLLKYRYSNDYSDPVFDPYIKHPGYYSYAEYTQDYPPPPGLIVQSAHHLDLPPRSQQGSLTRSIDTTSTLPLNVGNISQNSSLKRDDRSQEDSINNLGLPISVEGSSPIYSQASMKSAVLPSGLDVRYAATYGNPYLTSSAIGFGGKMHTSMPATTPAPPPYSAVRSSMVLPTAGTNKATSKATHV